MFRVWGFEQLTQFLGEAVLRNLQLLRIERPSVTQKWMIHHIFSSQKDVVVHATARTGKTLGYTLPIASKIALMKEDGLIQRRARTNAPVAIVLSPTKTFGYQLFCEIDAILRGE